MTEAKEAAGILADARDLIGAGWCQGSFATDANGRTVNFLSKNATRLCLGGSLRRALAGKPGSWKVADAVYRAVGNVLGFNPNHIALGIWNDHPERTKAEVMEVLAEGIGALVPPEGVCGRCNNPAAVWKFDGHARFKLCTECAASWPLARPAGGA